MNTNLLEYIPKTSYIENPVNPARIHYVNNTKIKDGYIVYICERELRYYDNFAVNFAKNKADELKLPLIFVHPQIEYEYEPKKKFIEKQLLQTKNEFASAGFNLEIIQKDKLYEYLTKLDISCFCSHSEHMKVNNSLIGGIYQTCTY